ncbi:MAG: sulfotransferase family protein [Planctomycetota bacterium]|nr:sulfotransferase family protein [Planctomycetota bacterium]
MNPRVRLNIWSGPRNVSTALMYAFAQRPDARVVDEPLYAHYLRVTGADHPGRELVLGAQENDGERVVADVILGPCDRPLVMFKQMAHHLVALDRGFLVRTTNVLLTREPEEMLTSLVENIPVPTLRDTGYAAQTEILEHLKSLGQGPVVLVAHRILQDPEGVLRRLCERVGVAFDPAMLSWKPGARPEDGVWAPFWYANVHRSSGFQKYVRKDARVPDSLRPLLATCREHYARLVEHAD